MLEDTLRRRYRSAGQDHVFRHVRELGEDERRQFLEQLSRIDIDLLGRIRKSHGQRPVSPREGTRHEPAPVLELGKEPDGHTRQDAYRHGEEILRRGELGVLLVAGGQGSRLGYAGPKGCLAAAPLSGRSLFELHAHRILHARRRYASPLVWYVMTSRANDGETRAFFEEHEYFGLPPSDVLFLCQRTLPALDSDGKLILESKSRIFESPTGHGGVYAALADGGGLDDARARGVRHLVYFQVDNLLVNPADPLFVGLHDLSGSEMSLKVVSKTGPSEGLGLVMLVDGRPHVVEYSEVSREEAEACDASGRFVYWAGSIGIHAFSLPFIERIHAGEIELPYHVARKRVESISDRGEVQEVEADKFEMFVFDALPHAEKFFNLEVVREREFAPIKNAAGEDSLQTARQLLLNEHGRWLRQVGIEARAGAEISPLAALGWRDLQAPLANYRDHVLDNDVLVELDAEGRVSLREA